MADQEYELETIRTWIWSGFYSPGEVRTMLEDIVEEDTDHALLHKAIEEEFARKRAEEANWPSVTDFDRLHAAFYKLHEHGICALHNAGYTMSDGYSEVAEVCAQAPTGHYHGYCFYHGQDVDRAVHGDGLMVAFGDLQDRDEEQRKIGEIVTAALREAGFEVQWDGSVESRISLPHIDWKQRSPGAAKPAPERIPPPETRSTRAWWQFRR